MKGTRLQNLAAVAGIVLLCVFAIWAQTGQKAAPSKKDESKKPAEKSAPKKTTSAKDHPFGQPAQIHILVSGCRVQEPMVHANGSDENPAGKVMFIADDNVVLTFNNAGVIPFDDAQKKTITLSKGQRSIDVSAKAADGQVYTQFQIGSCAPPFMKKKKEHSEDLSDPNEIIVP